MSYFRTLTISKGPLKQRNAYYSTRKEKQRYIGAWADDKSPAETIASLLRDCLHVDNDMNRWSAGPETKVTLQGFTLPQINDAMKINNQNYIEY